MRHRGHGYLAAAGVGTSMVTGFALALLVVSAVVGFRGWPTSSVSSPSSISVLPAAGSHAAPALTRTVGRVVLPAAPIPARPAAARTPASGHRRQASATSHPAGSAPIQPRPAADPTPKAPASPAPATVTQAPAAPRGGDGVRRTTQDAGAQVQQATQQAAQAVAPVAPVAGDALQAVGQAAAGAVKGTGDTLGGVVDALPLTH
jgi:hypothetical protein